MKVSLRCGARGCDGSTKELVICEDNQGYYVSCKGCLRKYKSQASVDELKDIIEYTLSLIKQPHESKIKSKFLTIKEVERNLIDFKIVERRTKSCYMLLFAPV